MPSKMAHALYVEKDYVIELARAGTPVIATSLAELSKG